MTTLRTAGLALALSAVVGCSASGRRPIADDALPVDASPADGSPALPGDANVQDAGTESRPDASLTDASDSRDVAAPPPDAPVGPFLDAPPGCPVEPASDLCARLGANCGSLTALDICGVERTVACGTCPPGSACGAGTAPNVCAGCAVESDVAFCVRNRAQCGTVTATDNCGRARTVGCGTCRLGESCDANHACSCTPESDAAFCARNTAECGSLTAFDNCGVSRTVGCGTCGTGSSCGGDGIPNRCQLVRVCEPPVTAPPSSVQPFTATPAPFAQNRCTPTQISGFIDACLASTASATACNAWRSANAACGACIATPKTAAAWGPVVTDPTLVSTTNPLGLSDASITAGSASCLDHLLSGCAYAFSRYDECLDRSCDRSYGCAGASPAAVLACRTTGETTACASPTVAAFDATSGGCRGVLTNAPVSMPGDVCVLPPDQRVAPSDSQLRVFVAGLIRAFCGP